MSYRRYNPNRIHPFHAYTFIGIALFLTVWLISLADTPSALANNEAELSQIVNEKDAGAEHELQNPDTILPIEDHTPDTDVPVILANGEDLNLTILPKGKHQRVTTSITIIASSEIDLASLRKSFTIVPNVPGDFSINGRVATFKPESKLAPQTKYTVSIDQSLYSKSGNILGSQIQSSFETEPNLYLLSVPYYRQQYLRSCESSSLRMALAYKGVYVEDMDVVRAAGYNPKNPDWQKRIWDNPYEMFVGYIDGPNAGYGMYAEALAKAANHFGRETKVLHNPSLSQLASEVLSGNPVVMWGYINNTVPKLSYFNTWAGERVPIYSNEHARTIVGVVGSENNPIGFYVHDPLSGLANEYWSAERLQKHMSIFGPVSNQALVIE